MSRGEFKRSGSKKQSKNCWAALGEKDEDLRNATETDAQNDMASIRQTATQRQGAVRYWSVFC